MQRKATVFISYSSYDLAFVERQLVPFLHSHELATWYSKDSIHGAEEWEKRIRQGLTQCDWFLVVLSRHSVASEWVQTEVHWALQRRRGRIVPILLDNCDPEDCHLQLRKLQYIDLRGDGTSAWTSLASVLDGEKRDVAVTNHSFGGQTPRDPRRRPRNALIAVVAAACLITVALQAPRLLSMLQQQSPDPTPPLWSEMNLKNGKLMFRTEKYALPIPSDDDHAAIPAVRLLERGGENDDASDHDRVTLTFQISNTSLQALTLTDIAVAVLGRVEEYEDRSYGDTRSGFGKSYSMQYEIVPERTDLGTLQFSFQGQDILAPRRESLLDSANSVVSFEASNARNASISLLSNARVEQIKPRSTRSFSLSLNCRGTASMLLSVRDMAIMEARDPFRDPSILGRLDVTPPEASEAAHVFALVVDVLTEDGERGRLYSDWVYAVVPDISRKMTGAMEVRERSKLVGFEISEVVAHAPDEMTYFLIDRFIKTHRETIAFRYASEADRVPANFNADEVSAACYFRDRDSPFRPAKNPPPSAGYIPPTLGAGPLADMPLGAVDTAPEPDSLLTALDGPYGRTNLVQVLSSVRAQHPMLWKPMEEAMARAHGSRDTQLQNKVRYVQQLLAVAEPTELPR